MINYFEKKLDEKNIWLILNIIINSIFFLVIVKLLKLLLYVIFILNLNLKEKF